MRHGALADAVIGGTAHRRHAQVRRQRCRGLGPAGANTPRASTSRLPFPTRHVAVQAVRLLRNRPGRVHREDALGPAADQAPGLRAAGDGRRPWRAHPAGCNPDGTPIADARRHPGHRRGQAPLPGARHRRQGQRTWRSGCSGRSEAGSHQVLQPASHRRRWRPLPAGGRNRSGFRARAGRAGCGGRQVHAEPGHHPPPRQQHRLDQRRQHPPVDHARPTRPPPIRRASACGTCRTWLAATAIRECDAPGTVDA